MTAAVVAGSANLDIVVTVPRPPRPGDALIGFRYSEAIGGVNQGISAARFAST